MWMYSQLILRLLALIEYLGFVIILYLIALSVKDSAFSAEVLNKARENGLL